MNRPAMCMLGRARARAALVALVLAAALVAACRDVVAPPPGPPRPQTIVLFATPKFMASEFADPDSAVARFLRHYAPLTSRAERTIVVFAVGNSQHILTYRGARFWQDTVAWAKYTDGKKAFDQVLHYDQLARIFAAFKRQGAALGLQLAVYDQIDPGNEMTWEVWKFDVHPECMDMRWISFDIRGRLRHDTLLYASAPDGTPEGKLCGEFIADQAAAYMRDMGLDGILYGNQFGTRGRWLPDSGPGYTTAEASAIDHFLQYSRSVYAGRQIMWFDSYNNTKIEHDTWSFPSDGYGYFDYIMASGFCVITDTYRYLDDLNSKLRIPNHPPIIATLDYVDPWYTYNSMTAFPDESARLEQIAIQYRDRIDGLVFFANDEKGNLVPSDKITSFATRFFGSGT
jgi:hypothetical protein